MQAQAHKKRKAAGQNARCVPMAGAVHNLQRVSQGREPPGPPPPLPSSEPLAAVRASRSRTLAQASKYSSAVTPPEPPALPVPLPSPPPPPPPPASLARKTAVGNDEHRHSSKLVRTGGGRSPYRQVAVDKFAIQTRDELATLATAEAAAVTRRATSGSASTGFSAHAVAVAGIYNEGVAKNRSQHPAPLQLRCFVSPGYIEQLLNNRTRRTL